ncbi:MAG TPA: hypothetical protein VNP04_30350 [Alphaproteobacteria bacterium]|nr:hypothetical protein [Alphaproteobacteria bacterium]
MNAESGFPAWYEVVRLHPDVESGSFTRTAFALDFGGVLANDPHVPLVHRDSLAFWQATHLTSGVRRLSEEVLARLTGQDGDRVLQLHSPFGGGKSHVLVALYHAAQNRESLDRGMPEARDLPREVRPGVGPTRALHEGLTAQDGEWPASPGKTRDRWSSPEGAGDARVSHGTAHRCSRQNLEDVTAAATPDAAEYGPRTRATAGYTGRDKSVPRIAHHRDAPDKKIFSPERSMSSAA